MSQSKFDLIVIGTGPSSSTVSKKVVADGKRVAVIESRGFGGTCALRGCNPKKVYYNAADLIDRARGGEGKLIEFDQIAINWKQLLAFKREFTDPVAEDTESSYQERGIETYHGAAEFTGPQSIRVGEQELTADRIFVGVGARPRPLDIPGGELAILSDEFFELAEVPRRIVFIGGGYISMEFACIAARAGADVTVLHRGKHVLSPFDPDLVKQLVDYSQQHGMTIHSGAAVTAIERDAGNTLAVEFEKSGETRTVAADLVVHGAGRIPNLDGLNLKKGEVDFGEQGIRVDPYMRSVSNPSVFTGGDCADSGKPMLTPTANEDARNVVKNLFAEEPKHKPDYGFIPQVAFTVPAIASIGLSQADAEKIA